MGKISRLVPLWIKEPLVVFLQEAGKIPLDLAIGHMHRNAMDICAAGSEKQQRVHAALQEKTYRYLKKKYKPLALELAENFSIGEKPEKPVIWMLWWNGEENAPDTIRRCIASIRANAGDIPVRVIDHRSFRDYVDVPAHLLERLENKTISFTHFSDYYRMALLARHGGLWLDASIFMKRFSKEQVFDQPFFTVRNPGVDQMNVSRWEWTVSVMGGWKGNTLFGAVSALLAQYWKDHQGLVDYYLFDYMIRLLHDHCKELRDMIAAVAPNNEDYYYFQQAFNQPLDEQAYARQKKSDTWLYKLTWKREYARMTTDGKRTVYDQWLKETDAGL